MDKLTVEQIKERIEAAFPPHRTVVEIYDYNARLRFEVTADNGHVLCVMPELLVDTVEDPANFTDVLRLSQGHVARKAAGPVGLDDSIRVNGRQTTLRKEHQAGHVKSMRGNNGAVIGKDPFGHWALIEGKPLPVSAVDHAFLRGEPATNT